MLFSTITCSEALLDFITFEPVIISSEIDMDAVTYEVLDIFSTDFTANIQRHYVLIKTFISLKKENLERSNNLKLVDEEYPGEINDLKGEFHDLKAKNYLIPLLITTHLSMVEDLILHNLTTRYNNRTPKFTTRRCKTPDPKTTLRRTTPGSESLLSTRSNEGEKMEGN
jgi:hypothetical protein